MKRIIVFTLALTLLLGLAACGKKAEEPTAPATQPTTQPPETTAETTIPAPTEPEWTPGLARAGYLGAVYKTFDAGDTVKVVGTFQDYYVVEEEDVDLLVEQRLVRLDSEEPFESWNGYTKYGTEVYESVYGKGEPTTLQKNTQITVLEGKEDWLYIEWEDGKGYVSASQISRWRISSGSSSGGGGGSGGGSSSGGSSGGGNSDGTDVDIGSLSATGEFGVQLLGAYYGPKADKLDAKGTVLAQDTEGYVCLLLRGDEVKVTASDEETVTIWLEGELFATLPRWAVILHGDAEFETWTGYSRWNGIIYGECQMRTELTKLSTNKQVTVLDELTDCYVVEYEGTVGYMSKDKVSQRRITTSKPAEEGGGGSSSGGGGGSGGTWTPPKM